ncbi:hypothetical protein L6452_35722 [Arctium lappa]|uniref:Uncharacterized protein n=1 Tax=Arctium lappa TaxID=4217 RepID=A0ACB8Y7R9_ARCLA|nr:hypothetical protein L6452_35722 [Arctium lappa]
MVKKHEGIVGIGGGKLVTTGVVEGMGSWNPVYGGIPVENEVGGLVTDELATHLVALWNCDPLAKYPNAIVRTFLNCGLITKGLARPMTSFVNYGRGNWFCPFNQATFDLAAASSACILAN